MRIPVLTSALLLTATFCCMAQTTQPAAPQRQPVKPYTVVQSVTTTEVYGNGATRTQTGKITQMRDSLGRTRREQERISRPAAIRIFNGRQTYLPELLFRSIMVSNPDGSFVNWMEDDSSRHEANLTHPFMRSSQASPPQQTPPKDSLVVEVHTGQLGRRAIQGVIAEGNRTTTKYPAGYDGVDREYTVTQESWMAVNYGFVAESMTDDPRTSKRVITTVSFSDAEPEAALFKPPADYTIVETVREPSEKP